MAGVRDSSAKGEADCNHPCQYAIATAATKMARMPATLEILIDPLPDVFVVKLPTLL